MNFAWVVLEWFVQPEDIPFPLNYLSHSWHFTTKPKLHFLSICFSYQSVCLSLSLFYVVSVSLSVSVSPISLSLYRFVSPISLSLYHFVSPISLPLLSLCLSYLFVSPISLSLLSLCLSYLSVSPTCLFGDKTLQYPNLYFCQPNLTKPHLSSTRLT